MTSFQTLIINVVLRPLVPLIAESLKARTLRDLAQAYNHTGLASTRGLQVEIEHQIRKFKEREERGE